MRISLHTLLFWIISATVYGQVNNEECRFATFIPSIDQFCSDPEQFSNFGVQADAPFSNTCFLNNANGVWFSFIPREPAITIQVFGDGVGGTMEFPKIAVFSDCNTYVECSPGRDRSSDELLLTELVIGQLYYVMIESAVGGEGTFQLCIDDFIAPRPPEADCGDAVVLCDKSPFRIENLNTPGRNTNEVTGSCIQNEFASSWYTWTCDQPGTLTFELIPNNNGIVQITDDLDFAIYLLPNGVNDCTGKELVRCMASGANLTGNGAVAPLAEWSTCNGPTGLLQGDGDFTELPGCQPGNNNYLAPLQMESGVSYGLVINNFSRSGLGFEIEFGGTGTFLGPEPDFDLSAVQAFECDKTIIFSNESFSATDQIVDWRWNFGVGASTTFVSGEGPHEIVYESFGDKIAALTVETSRGCVVTKVIEFYVDACCADTSSLTVDADVRNVLCAGEASGSIFGNGSSGAPEYQFSLDGTNFQPNPRFTDLLVGEYTLFIQDTKGCVNATTVAISEPPPLEVVATGDTTIDLGSSTQISASHFPPSSDVIYTWFPTDSLSCVNCPDPISKTPGTTTYIVQVEDEDGCIATDTLTVRVNIIRPIYAPNVISVDENGINDFFSLFGGPAAVGIEELTVFDRWGNLVYKGTGIPLNRYDVGWDGTYRGRPVNPGVFTWIAKVLFIDRVVEVFTGDITVVR